MKMKRKFKNMSLLTKIIMLVLVIGALIGIFGLISSLTKTKDDLKVVNLNWSIGELNSNGKMNDSKYSIYTKESFDCFGLKTELAFDSNITYKVFYYDELGNFLESTQTYNENVEIYVPDGAVKCRIVITPIFADDVEAKDREIKWYEVKSYAKQLTVYVSNTDRINSLELVKGVYKINVSNNSTQQVVKDFVYQGSASNDLDTYRIYIYSDVGNINSISKVGQNNYAGDYDLVLCAHKECVDTDALEIIKLLANAKDPTDYYFYCVPLDNGTYDYYFSLDNDALYAYLESLI